MQAPKPWLLVLGVLVASCVGSSTFEATASRPLIVEGGYSYDGRGVRVAEGGDLHVELDDAANTGRIEALIKDRGRNYEIRFDEFSGTPDRQGGGVRLGFDEHGDTGNGSTELPRFYAYAAAWGTATVARNGQMLREPNSLEERFPAHLMISRGMVRDPHNFQIPQADGTCCYDPAQPTDARLASAAGAQAFLQLKTASGAFFLHFQFDEVRVTAGA